MTVIDTLLDHTDPIGDETDSWAGKEWGVVYCTECGTGAESVSEGLLTRTMRCPNGECSVGKGRKVKSWAVAVGFTIVIAGLLVFL